MYILLSQFNKLTVLGEKRQTIYQLTKLYLKYLLYSTQALRKHYFRKIQINFEGLT